MQLNVNLSGKPTRNNNIKLTQEQLDIIYSPEPVVVVDAVAGSGKSTVLMAIADQFKNGLYLTFSKAVVQDISPKLPYGWSCRTFNSFGLMLCNENMGLRPNVNFKKYLQWESGPPNDLAQHHIKMAGDDTLESWKKTCARFKIGHTWIRRAQEIHEEMLSDQSIISGDEMMHFPVANGWRSKPFDVILIDEVQDVDPLQVEMLKLIPAKKMILVGDKKQAVFGFRGADVDVFTKLDSIYSPAEYPLNESFRCPNQVIKEVNQYVPAMWSKKTNGNVTRVTDIPAHFPDSCFILSRSNTSLMYLAHTLINRGDHFSVSPQVISKLKQALTEVTEGAGSMQEANNNLLERYQRRKVMYDHHGWDTAEIDSQLVSYQMLLSKFSTIKQIYSFFSDLSTRLRSSSKRKLLTIHAAKGLEHEHVYFLYPQHCHELAQRMRIDWQRRQEYNLYYVACTRSTKNLTFIT